jgi:type VI secretion system protein ImpC
VEEFDFEEDSSSGDNKFTWANAAYLMASNVARSFKIYGWCSRIRGIESGGAIEGLPTYTFPTDTGDADPKSPAEIGISDRSEAALAKAGFMPFIHKKNADFSAFIGAQSLQRPPLHDDPDRTANAALAARLPYLLVASRFAHYVRCIVRDRLGSFKGREDTQRWLQDWLGQYVDRVPDQSGEQVKAQRPLAFAEIQLADAENKHEYYDAILRVRPHYQIEGLTQPMEFAFRLPKL